MNFNKFRGLSTDPFISHMRISYEDGIRNQTEEYWRTTIASEIRNSGLVFASNDFIKNKIADLVERK